MGRVTGRGARCVLDTVRDEFEHVNCAVCGADVPVTVWETPLDDGVDASRESFFRCTNAHYGRFGRIVRCGHCGLLYRNPQERDLLSLYGSAVDEDYLAEQAARHDTFTRSFRQLRRFAEPAGRLLDVGCSTGFSLVAAREAGWDPVGLEPSRWAVRQACEMGLDVYEGTLEQSPFGPGEFDVVTLWDVIEHVRDPRAVLGAAFAALKPGGSIALTTMDVGSPAARLLGSRWPHLMRMHLWYFRTRHVVSLLEDVGFERVQRLAHVRVLSVSYLASRARFAGDRAAQAAAGLVRALRIGSWRVPVCLGDLIAVYAKKPAEGV